MFPYSLCQNILAQFYGAKTELALKQPFYIALSSGYLEGIAEAKFVNSVNNVTSAFSDSGALTVRLAKCLIGARPDTYLFGVTFNSLSCLNEMHLHSHKTLSIKS